MSRRARSRHMTVRAIRQFGLWKSPITPASAATGIRIADAQWDTDGSALVWLEERSGHGVLVCQELGDAPRDLTDDLNVRAKIGYGGGDFTVAGGVAFFVEDAGGRIYRQALRGGTAAPITPGFGRAASPTVSPDGRWVLYVHSDERKDRLAIVDSGGEHWPQIVAAGRDFYMQPVWSVDGARIAWVEWDHPDMPWDKTRLVVASLDETAGFPPKVRDQT